MTVGTAKRNARRKVKSAKNKKNRSIPIVDGVADAFFSTVRSMEEPLIRRACRLAARAFVAVLTGHDAKAK
jgi:hypothetical protein